MSLCVYAGQQGGQVCQYADDPPPAGTPDAHPLTAAVNAHACMLVGDRIDRPQQQLKDVRFWARSLPQHLLISGWGCPIQWTPGKLSTLTCSCDMAANENESIH